MRLGVMIGPERGDSARKVAKLVSDIEWAESAGMDTAWMPQVPNDFDCPHHGGADGHAHQHGSNSARPSCRCRRSTPSRLRARRCRSHAVAGGRLALGVGPSHHWIVTDMLGLPYEKPAAYTRDYLEVLHAALDRPGAGRRGERHVHRAQSA